jgi:GT2 family glycosyltransferase
VTRDEDNAADGRFPTTSWINTVGHQGRDFHTLLFAMDRYFSIIIPTRNRHRQLTACLDAIARLQYPRSRFEVVIVNDGGDASIESVILPFEDRLDVVLLHQPGAGPATARNAGAKKAKGRFIAFTDDDCMPAPDWLRRLADRFDSDSSSAFGGRTINFLTDNAYSTASQLLVSYLYDYYNADPDAARFLATNNIALPADVFHALDGFDPIFPRAAAEDRDFCDRLRLAGYRLRYAPEIIVYHSHPLRPHTFWRQHFFYGRGAFRFQQVRVQRSGGPFQLEPVRFSTGLFQYGFAAEEEHPPALLAVLLTISQIANTIGFLWEWASAIAQRNGSRRA